MKRIIAATILLAIAGAGMQTAKAGDKEWATAGKILTGVIAGVVIVNAVSAQPVAYSESYYSYGAPAYAYSPPPAYCPPPSPPHVVVAPAPVVCTPSPVIVHRTSTCVTPQPVVSVTFGKHYDRYDKHHGHHGKHYDRRGKHRGDGDDDDDDDRKRRHRR